MSWLDLGWLQRGDEWEFHPWGPFTRGYRLPRSEAGRVQMRIRAVRGAMLLVGGIGLSGALWIGHWMPLLIIALVGGLMEGVGTWWVVRSCSRTESSLGWENGLLYLAQWFGPKLLTLARLATIAIVAVSLYLIYQTPLRPGPYLLAAAFVALQFFLNYLEQVQRR